jgi:hypothetical protein
MNKVERLWSHEKTSFISSAMHKDRRRLDALAYVLVTYSNADQKLIVAPACGP